MAALRIGVIGEKFLDRSFIGTADRVSPEAPVPVVKVTEVIEQEGGAANVAANLEVLGVDVIKIFQPGHTPVKNRLFVGTQQIARWDTDDWTLAIDPRWLHWAWDFDGVIISDYNKGVFTEDNIASLSSLVQCPIFIDTKVDPDKYSIFNDGRGIFFPNFKEYRQYLDSYMQIDQVIRKDGASGLKYYDGGEFVFEVPALAKKVVSVNGAGDTVIAAFAYAICSGKSIIESADFASRAAAVAVQKPLTAVATLEEVENFDDRN